MKYIDLTHVIGENTPVSPFDEKIKMKRVKFLDKDYYNDTSMTSTMHIGTHIDAPSHMTNIEKNISDYDISKFVGNGIILDYFGKKNIDLSEKYKDKIKEDSIVIIYTGNDKIIGEDEYYYEHPIVSEELCDYLIEKKIKIIGLDFFSPDKSPSIIHKKLLQNDILIVENLKDVDLLLEYKKITIHLVPIKVDAEGAMIRAYALVE